MNKFQLFLHLLLVILMPLHFLKIFNKNFSLDKKTEIAQFLADEKVDIIFGTHPHSLQPIDILKYSDWTSETPVIY
ncbi:CapA family protein [Clostridium gasigenes]|uniref:CapA family protein n=1 Tax=Clostridium gasigenes TaxID=94869 RepID=UPI00209B8BDC|nr:CapA family protein [Clostridium gasigenes]